MSSFSLPPSWKCPGPKDKSTKIKLAVIRLVITFFLSNNKAITKMIKKDVPDAPTTGSSHNKLSDMMPKFSHGNPDITQDLSHSSKKKTLGIIKNLY